MYDNNIGVLVAVAHSALRVGFSVILSTDATIAIIGEASDGLEAIEEADSLKPDVILMELHMPRCDGLEATSRIKESCPESKVLIVLDAEREDEVRQALARGAAGYVLVSCSASELLHAVKRAAAGELVLSPVMASAMTARLRERVKEPELSAREDEVLNLLGEGLTNREIAERLVVSESTVRTYIGRLEEKLHLGTRNEAVAYAARRRAVIDPSPTSRGGAMSSHPAIAQTAPSEAARPKTAPPNRAADIGRVVATGERRWATVMWMELDGSVRPAHRVEPDTVEESIRESLDLAAAEVRRGGGIILWFSGNSLVSVFGVPTQEHAPHQALKVSLEILERLNSRRGEMNKSGIQVYSRIGVNSGPVLVGKLDNAATDECIPVGDTAEIAARAAHFARHDSVVVTESTYSLTKQRFRFDPLGELPSEGSARQMRVHRLEGASEERSKSAAPEGRSLTSFAGRDAEIEALMVAFEKVRSGAGQVMGIVGEAGIGKSRLVYEFRERLAGTPHVWLEGSCLSYGEHVPYLPLLDMLRSYFDVHQGEQESAAGAKIGEGIRQLNHRLMDSLPPLRDILSLEVGDSDYANFAPAQKRERIFEALKTLLLRQAQDVPLVLVLEDLQWIDMTSEDFLGLLVNSLANSRILLLLLYRPDYSHKWGNKAVYRQIRLNELTAETSVQMIRSILADGEVDTELQELVLERAGGNPLFLEEFISTLREEGSIIRRNRDYMLTTNAADISIPYSIQDIIQCRIERVDSAVRQTLQAASVIGPEFTYGILRAICGKEPDIKAHLRELQDLELIYEKRLIPEPEYSFKHNLTQELAYRSLIANKRKEAHQKTGEAIEVAYPDRLEAFYEILAHHYSRSANIVKAYHYLALSAAKATQSYSSWEAFRLGKQAIIALAMLPVSEDTMRKGVQLRLQMEGAMRLLAYPEDSSEIIQEGIRMCTDLGDSRSLAVLYSAMGLCCAFKGDPLLGIEYSRKCVEEAEKVEDVALLATVGFDLCSAYAITGHFAKTVEVAPRIIGLLVQHHRESEFLGGPFNFNLYSALSTYYGHALAWTGNFRKGEAVCQKALAFATQTGNLYSIAFAELMYGLMLNHKGDGRKAIQVLRNAVRHGEQGQVVPILIMAHNGLGNAHCCLGEMESARKEMARSLQIHEESSFRGLLSECRYDHGKFQLEIGDLDSARASAEEALRLSVVNHQIWVEGATHILLGRVLAKADPSQKAEAERHILHGMDIAADLGLHTFLAQGTLFIGELYAETGHPNEAIPHIRKAAEAFRKMGSSYWFDKAQEMLQKAKIS